MNKEIYLAGGCFWGVEAFFKKLPGVIETTCGYANGRGTAPTYEDVCKGDQGFAECVHIVYDSDRLSLPVILKAFFLIIDPTMLNKQGGDIGIQYRSGIYMSDAADQSVIDAFINEIKDQYDLPIVTEVLPLSVFYPAEEYHQDYLDKNTHGYCHINLHIADDFILNEGLKNTK